MLTPDIDPLDPYADCDHVVGGVWGNHVKFMDGLPSLNGNTDLNKEYKIWGHLPAHNRIENGHHITAEYQSSWVTLRVSKVEWRRDPRDMFFANARIVRQCAKDTGECVYLSDADAGKPKPSLMTRIARVFQ